MGSHSGLPLRLYAYTTGGCRRSSIGLKVAWAKEGEKRGDFKEIFCECGDIFFGEVCSGFFEGFGFAATLNDGGDVAAVDDREGEHLLDGDGGVFAGFDALKESHVLDLCHVVVDLWFLVVDGLPGKGVTVVGEADARFEERFWVEKAKGRTIRTTKEDRDFIGAQSELLCDVLGAGCGCLASFIEGGL